MSWNYRVMKKVHENGMVEYNLHEVYYKKDGNVQLWSKDPIAPTGETIGELGESLGLMQEALGKEVLPWEVDISELNRMLEEEGKVKAEARKRVAEMRGKVEFFPGYAEEYGGKDEEEKEAKELYILLQQPNEFEMLRFLIDKKVYLDPTFNFKTKQKEELIRFLYQGGFYLLSHLEYNKGPYNHLEIWVKKGVDYKKTDINEAKNLGKKES